MNHSYLALVTKVLGDTREVLNVHSNILDVETERELKEIEENGKAFGIGIIADIQERKFSIIVRLLSRLVHATINSGDQRDFYKWRVQLGTVEWRRR